MESYFDLNQFPSINNSVVTIGNFDGIHRGHQKILERVVNLGREKDVPSVVVTFDPHPRYILNKENSKLSMILGLKKKMDIFENIGIDMVLVIKFSEKFSKINAEEFLHKIILANLNPQDIVIGYDHHFGHKRTGSPAFVKKFGRENHINVEIISAVSDEDSIISSTQIRRLISCGYIRRANFELGWIYGFDAKVVKGSGRGHLLNFPTANFVPDLENQLYPKNGVYLSRGRVTGKQLYGMCNLGFRPTFNESNFVMEVHFFDFSDINLYSKHIRIEFLERIREEIMFNSKKELITQLTKDKNYCINLLKKYY